MKLEGFKWIELNFTLISSCLTFSQYCLKRKSTQNLDLSSMNYSIVLLSLCLAYFRKPWLAVFFGMIIALIAFGFLLGVMSIFCLQTIILQQSAIRQSINYPYPQTSGLASC